MTPSGLPVKPQAEPRTARIICGQVVEANFHDDLEPWVAVEKSSLDAAVEERDNALAQWKLDVENYEAEETRLRAERDAAVELLRKAQMEVEIMGNFLAAGSFTDERVAIMRRRVNAFLAAQEKP